jgi:hypothetical protein
MAGPGSAIAARTSKALKKRKTFMMPARTQNCQSLGAEKETACEEAFASMFINMEVIFWVALAKVMELLID